MKRLCNNSEQTDTIHLNIGLNTNKTRDSWSRTTANCLTKSIAIFRWILAIIRGILKSLFTWSKTSAETLKMVCRAWGFCDTLVGKYWIRRIGKYVAGNGRDLINAHSSTRLGRRAITRKPSVGLVSVPRVIRVAMQMKVSRELQRTCRALCMKMKFQKMEEPHSRVTWGRNVSLKADRLKWIWSEIWQKGVVI